MHRVKNLCRYSVPHFCSTKRIVETLADDGLPARSYEIVNLLTNDSLNTPPSSVFSLESQIASGQSIKRVSTYTLEPQELSMNQLKQLDVMNERYKFEQSQKNDVDAQNVES